MMDNFEVHNLVRALQPSPQYPAAFLKYNHCSKDRLLIHKSTPLEHPNIKNLVAESSITHLYCDSNKTLWLRCKGNTWLKISQYEKVH